MSSHRFFDFFQSDSNGTDPAPGSVSNSPQLGQLLVATEKNCNSRFERTVILLMQHDNRGSFGVALNKPAGPTIKQAWQKLTGADNVDDQIIVAGGPLKGPVFALHQIPDLSDAEMPGGLHVSAEINKLQQLMEQFENPYRIVVGVAGWKQGQLDAELASGNWYVMPMDAETVFDDPQWMWDYCLQECGRQQIADVLGNDLFPDDPSLN